MKKMDLGLIGLGVMGENLALNLQSKGFAVGGFDTDPNKRASFAQRTQRSPSEAVPSLPSLIERLKSPRIVWLMVPAGAPVDAVLGELVPLLHEGDIVIDGGNTLFSDTERRIQALQGSGVLYIGTGVSGGEEGALRGPALMPGGDAKAWPKVQHMLQAIAAKTPDGQACCEWVGPGGSGHFVKMVHNGIEYADMQLICEAYWLMKQLLDMPAQAMSHVFRQWNQGELGGYLMAITADILAHTDPDTGKALVDRVLDTAEQKGTGKWTSQIALDMGVSAPTIADAVFARTISALKTERTEAARLLSGPKRPTVDDPALVLDHIRQALLAAKICVYAQGFALLHAASKEHQWSLNLANVAGNWRAGCIIRAHLLEDIRSAFAPPSQAASETPAAHKNLLMNSHICRTLADCQSGLRAVVAMAALNGVPAPAFMSALSYYDAYRSERLPANLLQAQRDYFGAHTYQRVDKPGQFHTHWAS